MEINKSFDDDLLFEGYLYTINEVPLKYNFCITDILVKNQKVIDSDYELRYILINEYLLNKNLTNLNDNITISIHNIFTNYNLLNTMINNFIYKDQLLCIEQINNYHKTITKFIKPDFLEEEKIITKGKYSDVYEIYNIITNEKDGILYIKGIKESKLIKQLFNNKELSQIKLLCKYNKIFNKWQPIFN
jgi:hypothetical protein